MPNDSSTAFFSHWLTTQRPSAASRRRAACRRRARRWHSSTASRSSASARGRSSSARRSKAAFDDSLAVCSLRFLRRYQVRASREAFAQRLVECARELRVVERLAVARSSRRIRPRRARRRSRSWRSGSRRALSQTLPTWNSSPGRSPATSSIDRAVVLLVARDRDLHGRREHAHLARRAARHERLLARRSSAPSAGGCGSGRAGAGR